MNVVVKQCVALAALAASSGSAESAGFLRSAVRQEANADEGPKVSQVKHHGRHHHRGMVKDFPSATTEPNLAALMHKERKKTAEVKQHGRHHHRGTVKDFPSAAKEPNVAALTHKERKQTVKVRDTSQAEPLMEKAQTNRAQKAAKELDEGKGAVSNNAVHVQASATKGEAEKKTETVIRKIHADRSQEIVKAAASVAEKKDKQDVRQAAAAANVAENKINAPVAKEKLDVHETATANTMTEKSTVKEATAAKPVAATPVAKEKLDIHEAATANTVTQKSAVKEAAVSKPVAATKTKASNHEEDTPSTVGKWFSSLFNSFGGKSTASETKSRAEEKPEHAQQRGMRVLADVPNVLHKALHARKHAGDALLPDTPALMDKPSQVFQALNTQLGALKQHLEKAKEDSRQTVNKQQAEYEKQLLAQQDNSSAIKSRIVKLSEDISTLEGENSELRRSASKLQEEAKTLKSELSSLHDHFAIGQEFINGTLQNPVDHEEKTNVLKTLDEQDADSLRTENHNKALQAVAGSASKNIALLQFSFEDKVNAADVVKMIGERFKDLDRQQAASLAALKQSFDEEFAKEQRKQEHLVKKEAELIKKKDALDHMHMLLVAAEAHLKKTKSHLQERLAGIRTFAGKLSKV